MDSEDIGWLKAKMEDILDNQKDFGVRLKTVEEQISIYKTVIKFVKFAGLAVGAILTFKFGDVTSLWHRIFSG